MIRYVIIIILTGIVIVASLGTLVNFPNIPPEKYGQINTANCIMIGGLLAAITMVVRGMRKRR